MDKLIAIDDARDAKQREMQAEIIEGLEALLRQAKKGDFKGICYCCISKRDHGVWLGAFSDDECGAHELVGASAMLADHILLTARD